MTDDDRQLDREILEALDGAATTPARLPTAVRELVPKRLVISDRDLLAGQLIGPATRDIGKANYESGGFFLADLNLCNQALPSDLPLSDFIIPNNMPVNFGSIHIAEHFPLTSSEVSAFNQAHGTNFRLTALFHVHPTGFLQHSLDDDTALESIVNKMALTTQRVYYSPFEFIRGRIVAEYQTGGMELTGDQLTDSILRFVYPDDQAFLSLLKLYGFNPNPRNFSKGEFLAKLLEQITVETDEPRIVCYASSWVFDNNGSLPFVKLGIEERFPLQNLRKYSTISYMPYEIIDLDENLPTESDMRKLVQARIRFPPVYKPKKLKRMQKLTGQVYPPAAGTQWSENWYDYPAPYRQPIQLPAQTAAMPDKNKYVQKTEDWVESNTQLAIRFAYAAFSYLTGFQDPSITYSTYMDMFIWKLSERTYEQKTGQYHCGSPLEAILEVGELYQDDPDAMLHPLSSHRDIPNLVENILDYLVHSPNDQHTIGFMISFIKATTAERSGILEKYVSQIIALGVTPAAPGISQQNPDLPADYSLDPGHAMPKGVQILGETDLDPGEPNG